MKESSRPGLSLLQSARYVTYAAIYGSSFADWLTAQSLSHANRKNQGLLEQLEVSILNETRQRLFIEQLASQLAFVVKVMYLELDVWSLVSRRYSVY